MTGFTTAVVTLFFTSIQFYKHCHSSMHLITLNSQNITGLQSKHLIKMADGMDVECFHINRREFCIYGRLFHIHGRPLKNPVQTCVFSVFRAVQILDGYNLIDQMKRARNSDSETHVKKLNPNSRTEIRRKSLKYLRDTLYTGTLSVEIFQRLW